MAKRTAAHLRSHLSVFEAGYPIQKGYIGRLLIVDGRSVVDVVREVRCIVPTTEPGKILHERSLGTQLFPLITVEEFAMGSAQSGILKDREGGGAVSLLHREPKACNQPRCCLTGKEQVVSRFCQIESRWGYSGTKDRIRFMVNRRIFVVGFGLYGSIHGPTEYAVNIQHFNRINSSMCNPGGSGNIQDYISSSMLEAPWRDLPPRLMLPLQ